MAEQQQAFVYDAIRTPRGRGKKNGSLHEVKPVDLVVGLLDEVRRPQPRPRPGRIDDVVLGVVTPIGDQGGDIAKTAALAAGYPETVAGVQLNRFCASGLEAVNQAAMRVRSGFEDLILAGGVESMSRVPMGSDGGAWAMDPRTALDTSFVPQGIGADLIATLEGWSREDVDALRGRVAGPGRQGAGQRLLRPLGHPGQGLQRRHRPGERRVHPPRHDGREPRRAQAVVRRRSATRAASTRWRWRSTTGSRRSTTSTTPATPPASSTAPRSSSIGTEQVGVDLGLTPRARILAAAVSGADPTIMLTGPAPASRKALAKAGLEVERHRPLRDQRGVRRGRHAVHARPRTSRTRRSTSTAARSRWATRSARPAR